MTLLILGVVISGLVVYMLRLPNGGWRGSQPNSPLLPGEGAEDRLPRRERERGAGR